MLITLISKWYDAFTLDHFRPISLYITLYKVCAKILIKWLQLIMPCLISPESGAFINEHCITDNIFLIQEFMHDLQHASI